MLFRSILLNPNCDWKYDNGTYRLLVEGLGTRDTEEIQISGTESDVCKEVTDVKKVRYCNKTYNTTGKTGKEGKDKYEIFSWDGKIKIGEKLKTVVLVRNTKNETKELEVYSYIYEGNVPVNEGGWDGNSKTVQMGPEENKVLKMKNKVKEGTNPGTYQLKVRIKGETDLVRNVEVIDTNKTSSINESENKNNTFVGEVNQNVSRSKNTSENPEITGKVFKRKGPLEEIFQTLIDLLGF